MQTDQPTILAFESSAERCEVALIHEGRLSSLSETAARAHARRLLPMADELIRAAGLGSVSEVDVLAFDAGPGGFTGLRIAAALVQGLAYVGGQPVSAVSSLMGFAWQLTATERLSSGDRFACVIDARMSEVYWQIFEVAEASSAGLPFHPICDAQLSTSEVCLARCRTERVSILSGDYFSSSSQPEGFDVVADQLHAASIALLAQHLPGQASSDLPKAAIPTYLRGASAWKKTTHKAGATD
ncbi:tRNA (adenosine(37)-N6)-threonylcarbamoyltransferase complex dimerization subunit type 1 TsaB [Allohahella marinimesophila]|uniref:tRNA threonylcarbamoyladenosine biosynthesis protein TsaB n=1 Tax=Allohahella marinimesophila TaxID=1054972 RepID=A0ABP7NLP2_9GAMM